MSRAWLAGLTGVMLPLAGAAGLARAAPAASAAARPAIARPAEARPAIARPAPQVRVDQVGYVPSGQKVAYAMLARPVTAVRFAVTGRHGVVYRGVSADDLGSWSSGYRAVYRLNFSGVRAAGDYRITITSPVTTSSPAFAIGEAQELYGHLVDNAVRYFTSERDGPDVDPAVLGREPANLTDSSADVYADPAYDGNDNLVAALTKTGGPVDVSGGWFDAGGGYEKFAYTASYADALMLMSERANPGGRYPALGPEARFGLQWITKLWNPSAKVLYAQVGIGNGSAPTPKYPQGQIQGDYNFWFAPQDEDQLNVAPGDDPGPTAYYVKYRPVFAAAPPGKPVSPNLAGRFAADFALGAQLDAADRASAAHLLTLARGVFAMARTTNVGQIVTAFPHDYYPGSQWKSDMAGRGRDRAGR